MAIVVVVALALPALAKPSVSWEPSKLQVTAVNASTSIVEVSFIATKDLPDVVVRVAPELAAYVAVEPSELGDIGKGETQTLTLLLAIPPETVPQILDGTIQLRHDGKPARVYAKPLPVELSIEPIDLPPDPGEEGKATLEGIDSDGDGLRDDIQRYIALEYWDEPEVQEGLRDFGRVLGGTLLSTTSATSSIAQRNVLDLTRGCLVHRSDDLSRALEAMDEVIARTLNTRKRSETYFVYDANLSGRFYDSAPPTKETCEEVEGLQ